MIYTLILKPKFRNILRVLTFAMFVAFTTTLYSCETTKIYDYTPEELRTDDDVKYIEAKTNNDSTINLSDYNVTYHENYKDSSNILLFEKTDTTHSYYLGRPTYKVKKSLTEINLKDIKNIKVERTEFSSGKTWIFAGVVFLALVIIILASLPPLFPTPLLK